MRTTRSLAAAALAATLLTTAACTTNPETGNRRIDRTVAGAVLGGLGGYLLGDLVGGRGDRTEKILGAGIGAIAGGAVGNYMDRQEAELRRQTAGTGVDVIRQGDDLVLRMPSGITFDVDRSDIKPQFQSTLDEVAQTLGQYNQTYIDVLGHTDSTGSDAYNQALSERRAQAVAGYLSSRGVAPARMAARGFGETQPIADNATEYGRAQNRRVEIKVVPFRG
ncbi:OmpA family protein [Sphingomonas sp. GCM10030256]|uniref:OmpA family protein n=1 Tax=Sphingomonas sp. GCM10030256 TaxID=3273427 RepID=UPI0036084FCF